MMWYGRMEYGRKEGHGRRIDGTLAACSHCRGLGREGKPGYLLVTCLSPHTNLPNYPTMATRIFTIST